MAAATFEAADDIFEATQQEPCWINYEERLLKECRRFGEAVKRHFASFGHLEFFDTFSEWYSLNEQGQHAWDGPKAWSNKHRDFNNLWKRWFLQGSHIKTFYDALFFAREHLVHLVHPDCGHDSSNTEAEETACQLITWT